VEFSKSGIGSDIGALRAAPEKSTRTVPNDFKAFPLDGPALRGTRALMRWLVMDANRTARISARQ
jgi:hypothetical protein